MTDLRNMLALAALLGALSWVPDSHATAPLASSCTWSFTGPIPMTYKRDMGTLHVPRDAPVGAVIGQIDNLRWSQTDGRRLTCFHAGDGALMRMRFVERVPIFPTPLPPFDGEMTDGHVLETGIDGVGVRVRVSEPFAGDYPNHFDPEHGHTSVPFNSIKDSPNQLGSIFGLLHTKLTFIKTGDIAPGIQQISNKQLFSGILDFESHGEVFKFVLDATIVQAECSISGDPVTPNPVDLLEWDYSHFTGTGTRTTTVPFSISLTGCVTDPAGKSRVTLQLDPTNGSKSSTYPGVFTMSTDAEAAGVGIQVVRSDGSPLPLEAEQDMMAITSGNMRLDLGAHLFQTEAKVTPGAAKGALNFTLRYR